MKELDDFTVERLQAFIDKPLDNGFTREEQMALARIALAAKTSEESCVRLEVNVGGNTWVECSTEAFNRRKDAGDMVRRLYESPVLNSPVIPDGWIKCSERMPEKRGHYLVCTESGLVARSFYSQEHADYDDVRGCHKLARKDFGKYSRHFEYARVSVSKITHWMRLPPPPTTEK